MSSRSELAKRLLASKEYAEGLVAADSKNTIAFQLRVMQEDRGWTQQELAERADMGQSQISAYLNGYDSYNVATLRRLAAAFDVSLVIAFEAFYRLANRVPSRSASEEFSIPGRLDDRLLRQMATYTVNDVFGHSCSGAGSTWSGVPEMSAGSTNETATIDDGVLTQRNDELVTRTGVQYVA